MLGKRARGVCLLVFLLGLGWALPAVADCDDTSYTVQVWYTAGDSLPPAAGDSTCAYKQTYTYRVGQCWSWSCFCCSTSNCGWGPWRGSLRRKALASARATIPDDVCTENGVGSCAEQARACGKPLTLWGARFSGDTQTKWTLENNSFAPAFARPAVGRRVYWGDASGDAVQLNEVSKEARIVSQHPGQRAQADVRSRQHTEGPVASPAVGPDGTVYLTTGERLWAFYESPFRPKWKYPASEQELLPGRASQPAVASDGTIYFTTGQGWVYKVGSDGRLIERRQLGGNLIGVSLGGAPTIYIGSSTGGPVGRLYALDENLDDVWTYQYQREGATRIKLDPPSIAADGTLFVPTTVATKACNRYYCVNNFEAHLISLDPSGFLRWDVNAGSSLHFDLNALSTPSIANDARGRWLFFGVKNEVFALRDGDGKREPEWTFPTAGTVSGTPAVSEDGTIFATTTSGMLYAIERKTGEAQWELKLGGSLHAPVLDRQVVYVGSTLAGGGNALHAVHAGSRASAGDWPMAGRGPGNAAQAHRGLAASPLSWDFGVVDLGQSSMSRVFEIANHGDDTIRGSIGLREDTGEFSVDFDNCRLEGGDGFELVAGASCELELRYEPKNPGTKKLEIVITSDDPTLPELVLRPRGASPAAIMKVGAQSIDFGSLPVNPQTPATRALTIKNDGDLDLIINDISLTTGSGFELVGGGAPLTVGAGASTTLSLRFAPDADGLATATLRLSSNDPVTPVVRVLLLGVGGAQTERSLIGYVLNADTGEAVGDATVQVGSERTVSSGGEIDRGFYRIDGVPAGDQTIKASREGYQSFEENRNFSASPGTETFDIGMTPACGTVDGLPQPRLAGIRLHDLEGFIDFDGHVTFVNGISHRVRATAVVDWCGGDPGTVRFAGPNFLQEPPASGNEVSIDVNVGDFPSCFKLTAQAFSANNVSSNKKTADLSVMPRALPLDVYPDVLEVNYTRVGDGFLYENSSAINFALFDLGRRVPGGQKLLGGRAVGLGWIPSISETYESDGKYEIGLAFEGLARCMGSAPSFGGTREGQKRLEQCIKQDPDLGTNPDGSEKLPSFKALVADRTDSGVSIYPTLSIEGEFNERTCRNSIGGQVGLSANFEAQKTVYFSAVPPVYGKLGVSAKLSAAGGITGFGADGGPEWTGEVIFEPALKASAGVGVSDLLGVEAWATGGVEFGVIPLLETCEVYAKGGITFYAVLFTWEETIAAWTYDCSRSSDGLDFGLAPVTSGPTTPVLVSRDYARTDSYGTFQGGDALLSIRPDGPLASKALPSVVQENVFPYSETNVSASGDHVYLAWLYDDLGRTDANRTVVTFATWNGTSWTPGCGDGSAPCAVSDDGTADFHPNLLTLPDGSAHVAWENLRAEPGAEVDLDGMLANVEICTSRFDSTQFGAQQCLTDNTHLDRSPKLAGAGPDDVLLAWISNESNDMSGGPDAPNVLWSSRYSGQAWSEPQRVVELPFPLTRFSLAYDGADGYLVMSLDADEQSLVCAADGKTRCADDEGCADLNSTCALMDTVIDRDLFLLHYDAQTDSWDNPQDLKTLPETSHAVVARDVGAGFAAAHHLPIAPAEPVVPARLTDDDLADDSPQVILDPTGKFVLVWLRDDAIAGITDLAGFVSGSDQATIETIWRDESSGYSSNLSGFSLARNGNQLSLVWARPAEGGYSDLVASLYDSKNDLWGEPRVVNEPDLALESYVAATFDFDGNTPRLLAVYDRTPVSEIVPEDALHEPKPLPDLVRRQTDLVMLVFPLRDDPALDEFSLRSEPFDPTAGQAVTLSVDVVNLGDRGLESAVVRFYADPGTGAEEIVGTAEAIPAGADPLEPGGVLQAKVDWVIPAGTASGLALRAEIDPDGGTDDRDPTNNEAKLTLLTPDLTVRGVSWKRLDGGVYEIVARVVNAGSATVTPELAGGSPILARIRDGATDGPLLAEEEIDELAPGESFEMSLLYDYDLSKGPTATIFVVVDQPGSLPESDEDNNVRKLLVTSPDIIRPTLIAPARAVFEATGPQGAIAEFEVSATDDVSGEVPVICSPPQGGYFGLGDTDMTCTATDAAGNVASETIVVSVVDTTPPDLSAPDDVTAECAAPAGTGVSLGTPTTSDLYCVDDVMVGNDAPGVFPFAGTTVTWTATDCNDNTAIDDQSVTVVDTSPPSLTIPEGVVAECESPIGTAVEIGSAAATDVCCGDDVVINNDAPALFPLGDSVVTWGAEDCHGVGSDRPQSVLVQDTTPPSGRITGPAPGSCHGPAGLPVAVGDDFSDICDAEPSRTYLPGPGPGYSAHGDYTVELTVTDDSGNWSQATVPFTIDTVLPGVTIHEPPTTAVIPRDLPLDVVFDATDADGANGPVLHEVILLDGCPIYDGLLDGDQDGLLSDETVQLDEQALCRVFWKCGTTQLFDPELRVNATDCGGNLGHAKQTIRGGFDMSPAVCPPQEE